MTRQMPGISTFRSCRRYSYLTTISAILALAILMASPVFSQETPVRTISVSAQGEASGAPDIVRISIGVVTESQDATEATAANAERTQKVIDALVAGGVERRDIQTSQYSLQPQYDYQASPPRLRGYQVSNMVNVTVRNVTMVGSVIDRAIGAGANSIHGISFAIENEAPLRNQALVSAMEQAREKARLMATTLEVSVVRLRSASESVERPGTPPVMFARSEAAGAPPTPIEAGEMRITATVHLVYEIQ